MKFTFLAITFFTLSSLCAQDNPRILLLEEKWDHDTDSWINNIKQESTFDSNDLITMWEEFEWNEDEASWQPKQRHIYQRNNAGQLTLDEKQWATAVGEYGPRMRSKELFYNDDGCLVERFDSYPNQQKDFYSSRYRQKRFTVDQDCKILFIEHFDTAYYGDFRAIDTVLQLNGFDTLSRFENNDVGPNNEVLYYGSQYEKRNSIGLVIEEKKILYGYHVNRRFPDKTGNWRNFEYDEHGNLIYTDYYIGRRSSHCHSKGFSEFRNTYDDLGRRILQEKIINKGHELEDVFWRIEYDYYPCSSKVYQSVKFIDIKGAHEPVERKTYAYLKGIACPNSTTNEVMVFPNPAYAQEDITIYSSILTDPNAEILLYDVSGKLLYREINSELINRVNFSLPWDLHGLYILTIRSKDNSASTKITFY